MGEYTDRDRILCGAFFSVIPHQELTIGPNAQRIWPRATLEGIYHLAKIGVITEIGDHQYRGTETSRDLAQEFLEFSDERKKAAQQMIIDRPANSNAGG